MVDQLAHIVGLKLDSGQNRAIPDGTVGSKEDEIVWEICGSDSKIRFWLGCPFVLQVLAARSDQGKARFERRV